MRPKKKTLRRLSKHLPRNASIAFSDAGLRSAAPASKEYTINDPRTPGLHAKVTPSGKKVFVYRYRTQTGRQRKFNVGRFPDLRVSEARRRASKLSVEVADGGDPAGHRHTMRHSVTVSEFAERYLAEYAKPKLAPSTYKEYKNVLETRVLPMIGRLSISELGRADIHRLHVSMNNTPVRANRMLSVVKAMLYRAEDWEVLPRGGNPAARFKLNKEHAKRKYFNESEQRALFQAIDQARSEMPRSQSALNAITLLFFTGCRPSEVLRLRWEDIDLVSATALLQATKTGEHRLPLAPTAIEFLQSIAPEEPSTWVFAGAKRGEPLKYLTRPWKRVCLLAGMPDACLKDIRHTVGTYLASVGGLYSAQVVLRHTNPKTTMVYAHPMEQKVRADLRQAVEIIDANRRKAYSRKGFAG